MYEIFFHVPPRTKILAPPLYTSTVYTVYLSVVTCVPQFLLVADPMQGTGVTKQRFCVASCQLY